MVYEKEVYIFDFLDLIANIGGYLGLFLGARCVKNSFLLLLILDLETELLLFSLLSLYDDTKRILEYATRKFRD